MIKHIVFFKFTEDSPEKRAHLKKILEDLNGAVPSLKHLEAGSDVVGSERSSHLALVSDFEDMEALQAYQVHPKHQEVIAWVKENCNETKAVDYEY